MNESENLDHYLKHMIAAHETLIIEAHDAGDDEFEHRNYWIKYALIMVQDYLAHCRAGDSVIKKYADAITGLKER